MHYTVLLKSPWFPPSYISWKESSAQTTFINVLLTYNPKNVMLMSCGVVFANLSVGTVRVFGNPGSVRRHCELTEGRRTMPDSPSHCFPLGPHPPSPWEEEPGVAQQWDPRLQNLQRNMNPTSYYQSKMYNIWYHFWAWQHIIWYLKILISRCWQFRFKWKSVKKKKQQN